MSGRQSYAEFVLGVYASLLKDCEVQYPELAKEFNRDYQRLRSAFESNGLYFFVEIMPAYRKHFDQCLAMQRLTTIPGATHFGSWKRGGKVPRLFRGLFLRVFELDGTLRPKPDVAAIRLIRQLLGACRRLRLETTTRNRCEAVDEFYQVDQDVKLGDPEFWESTTSARDCSGLGSRDFRDLKSDRRSRTRDPGSTASRRNVGQADSQLEFDLASDRVGTDDTLSGVTLACLHKIQLVADLITGSLGSFNPLHWRPKHGPGAVADQSFGSYRYDFGNWPSRLESVFPYADFAFSSYGTWAGGITAEAVDAGFSHEFPAVLHAVPKTLAKPRLIAAEPTALQWCQQVVRDYFYSRVRETFIRGFVDFGRQDLNGVLAREASHHMGHATLDLSSASDRVSCWHIERLFRRSPDLLDALRASRSLYIKQDICSSTPRIFKIRKYSTMGNATTFPVQTLLFLALALGCVCYMRDLPVNLATMRKLAKARLVRVFGDDIIVPEYAVQEMLACLKAFSMKVNPTKTFVTGKFRESCGVDAYDGHIVTSNSILDMPRDAAPGSIVSNVDVHNNLMSSGYWKTAAFIRKTVEQTGFTQIRTVPHGSGDFGWSDLDGAEPAGLKTRWNDAYQVREIRCLNITVKGRRVPPTSEHGLLQFFTEAAKKVTSSTSSIGYLVRRPQAKLRLRWVPVSAG